MWFDSWYDLARILVVGPVAYAVLVAVLRSPASGPNAFDLVVIVAWARRWPPHSLLRRSVPPKEPSASSCWWY
jgi:hypothetical protein